MILVTGASGFIGKNLIDKLIFTYGSKNIIALTSTLIEGVNCVLHNDYNFNSNFFVEKGLENVHTLIHAGAFTPKKSSEANLIKLCNSNIYSTEKILDTDLPNLKRIIFLSTLDVYAPVDLISEETEIQPISLYGYSKLYSEKIIELWSKENGIEFQILRVGHVYGPGEEKYNKVIPLCLKRILNNQPVQVYGTGGILRSFIYVDDVVEAIIKACTINNVNEIINVVSGNPISIIDILKLLAELTNKNVSYDFLPENVLDRNLVFDNSKMLKILEIKETPLETGLRAEVEFMKNFINK
jgi:UDP-glucose 4-epimerase